MKLSEYEQWRIALDEGGAASTTTTKRIRELERELARKEKALAEAAALVVGRSPGAGLSPARHFGANHRALAC